MNRTILLHATATELQKRGLRINIFDILDNGEVWRQVIASPELPEIFTLKILPEEIPTRLLELSPDTRVILRDEHGGSHGGTDSVLSASFAVHEFKVIIERQKAGRFHVDEVAHMLATDNGCDVQAMAIVIRSAFDEGQIVFIDEETNVRLNVKRLDEKWPDLPMHHLSYGAYTTPECVIEWADKCAPELKAGSFRALVAAKETPPGEAPPVSPAAVLPGLRQQEAEKIPGNMPKTANGILAIEAAWELERRLGRAAK